jgi:hypothetical protein
MFDCPGLLANEAFGSRPNSPLISHPSNLTIYLGRRFMSSPAKMSDPSSATRLGCRNRLNQQMNSKSTYEIFLHHSYFNLWRMIGSMTGVISIRAAHRECARPDSAPAECSRGVLLWWEVDMTYLSVRVLSALGVAHSVKLPALKAKMRDPDCVYPHSAVVKTSREPNSR